MELGAASLASVTACTPSLPGRACLSSADPRPFYTTTTRSEHSLGMGRGAPSCLHTANSKEWHTAGVLVPRSLLLGKEKLAQATVNLSGAARAL